MPATTTLKPTMNVSDWALTWSLVYLFAFILGFAGSALLVG